LGQLQQNAKNLNSGNDSDLVLITAALQAIISCVAQN